MHHRTRPLAVALLLAALVLPWTVAPGAAPAAGASTVLVAPAATPEGQAPDSTVTWGVRPADSEEHGAGRANYAYAAEPGQVLQDALIVTNHDRTDLTLAVYAADGFTTSSGVLDLLPGDQESIGLGAWTSTPEPRIVVPAGERAEVPFTIRVPDDATPGDHSGGIVTSLLTEQSQGFSLDRRLGSRIHLRVVGDLVPTLLVEDLVVDYRGPRTPAGRGGATVAFRVVNGGNVRMSATQEVTVSGPFGLAARTEALEVPELLPGAGLDVEVEVDRVPPLVRLGAEVRLAPRIEGDHDHPEPDEVVGTATTWAVPWSGLGLLALVAALVATARWRARRRDTAAERQVEAAVAAALAGRGQEVAGDGTRADRDAEEVYR